MPTLAWSRGAKLPLFLLSASLLTGLPALSDPPDLSAEQVQRARRQRLDGQHFTAEVDLEIERDGKREERRLLVWRDDEESQQERLLARFAAPPDLRDFGLLFVEQEGRPNDYFVHQPELRRVRRVSEAVVSQDIYGVDLEFLAFGIVQSVPTEAESVEVVDHDGRRVYRLTERALEANQRFDERVSWIDAESFLTLRTEHLRGGKTVLVANAEEVETVQGVATPGKSTFERPGARERVTMVVDRIDYELPIPPEFFSTLSLIKR